MANSYVRPDRAAFAEPFYPLHAWVCTDCWLVQLEKFETPEAIFGDYAYFSSYSDSWVEHARRYVEMACDRFALGPASKVVELASNDGYLLQHFVKRGVPVLGVEPAANVAQEAVRRGIPTEVKFFGVRTARDLVAAGHGADLVIGNNVLAHVPDINDFVGGIRILLRPGGVVTIEFPHLVQLVDHCEFDTIYHEHFSYLSFTFVRSFFAKHGLRLFDVEELPTHGGSLRIFGCLADDPRPDTPRALALAAREEALGLRTPEYYRAFGPRVAEVKFRLLEFLIAAKRAGKRIAGYGAPAKGNTLLNYCGVRTDLLDYTVDRSPHKQGCLLPGTRIPVRAPDHVRETRPDYLLILPWNLRDEITAQMAYIREWGGRFVVPIPAAEVLP